jgi:hypothetical protein
MYSCDTSAGSPDGAGSPGAGLGARRRVPGLLRVRLPGHHAAVGQNKRMTRALPCAIEESSDTDHCSAGTSLAIIAHSI